MDRRHEAVNVKRRLGVVGGVALLAAALGGCGGAAEDPAHLNQRVKSVIVVGTSVTNQIYADGGYGITLVPLDQQGKAVLGQGLDVAIAIDQPAGFTSQVQDSSCTVADPGAGLAVGVIIDDSGSMASSDPKLERKDAAVAFIDTVGPGDEVLLTDYGYSGSDLRDLVCAAAAVPGVACTPPTAAGFTADKTVLEAATAKLGASGGTPLYESCVQMIPLVASRTGKRQAILLLSDGAPSSSSMKSACIGDAVAAGIPIFTIGLGPAAETPTGGSSQASAVQVLRELASATGGAYASADEPDQLMALFANVGTALSQGKCGTNAVLNEYAALVPGTTVTGTVTVGANQATGTFQFVAPPRP